MHALFNLVGETLGKYQIEKLVGQGGTAIVYRARHADFDLPVALKFLLPDCIQNDMVRHRFKREARLQFKLRHAHLVRVFELIEERGLLGMAMDWVDGPDLKMYIDEANRPLHLDEIRRYFLPVLDVVGYAHEQQIIHRDLKPANILLEEQMMGYVPKVADFGIAKLLDEAGIKTKTGSVLGTPHYMAPEQASHSFDHRVDIYALGVMLYQMLCGHLPFENKQSIMELLAAHLSIEPPEMKAWGVEVAPELEAIAHRALAKSPNDRFSSCHEFSLTLTRTLDRLGPPPTIVSSQRPELPTGDDFQQAAFDDTVSYTSQTGDVTSSSSSSSLWTWGLGLAGFILLGALLALLFFPPQTPRSAITPRKSTHPSHAKNVVRRSPPQTRMMPRKALPQSSVMPRKVVPVSLRLAPVGAIAPVRRSAFPQAHARSIGSPRKIKARSVRRSRVLSASEKQRCYRCVRQHCTQCISRKRQSLQGLPGSSGSQTCNRYAFVRLGKRCARACRRSYPAFCRSYLRLLFRSGAQGPIRPARNISVCRGFTHANHTLRSLRNTYGRITKSMIQQCWKR